MYISKWYTWKSYPVKNFKFIQTKHQTKVHKETHFYIKFSICTKDSEEYPARDRTAHGGGHGDSSTSDPAKPVRTAESDKRLPHPGTTGSRPETLAATGVPRVQAVKSTTSGKNGGLSLAAMVLKSLAASVNSRLDVLYR